MNDSLQKQEMSFQQTVNRFIGYGVAFILAYTFFAPEFAFLILLPALLWWISKPLQVSLKCFFYDEEKQICWFESLTLVILFASTYIIYVELLASAGIMKLYYGAEAWTNVSVFAAVISAPIMEELLFRGVGIGVLRKYGNGFSILTTWLLFILMHVGVRVVIVLPSGLMLGILMVLTKNIFFPVLLHIMVNGWVLEWSSSNILVQLLSKESPITPWSNLPVTLAINVVLIALALIILWKRPFFVKLLNDCNPRNVIASIKCNKELYKEFFALKSVRWFLAITVAFSLYNLIKAILVLI